MSKTNRAPKTVKSTIAALAAIWAPKHHSVNGLAIDGMRAPELAAVLGLDETLTFKAVAKLVKSGDMADRGDLGLFRVTGAVFLHLV